jgi:hypothetical protein
MPTLAFDLGELDDRSTFVGRRLRTCQAMVRALEADGRLDVVHMPMVEHLYGLCEALDKAGGRGASYALLSAQFDRTWERLASLPMPEPEESADDLDYDVMIIAPVGADAG